MAYTTPASSLTAYFSTRSNAQSAVEALRDAGFSASQISLAVRPEYGADDNHYSAGYTAGEKTKGVWRSIADFFEGHSDTGANDTEPAKTRASAVPATPDNYGYDRDDFSSSIRDMKIPEQHAQYFSHRFGQGAEGALVTVATSDREAEAERILAENGGDLGEHAANFRYPEETGTLPDRENTRVQLFGEILKVHKDRVARGDVTIRKNVVTENKTFEVPVTREELVITRRPVAAETSAAAGAIGEQKEIRVPLSEERVSLHKQNVVLEEVSIGKRAVTESQTLTDTARHEELEVDDLKRAPGTSATPNKY